MLSMDIGIDLGTANMMITMGSKGIVLDEPSVVAYNQKTGQVMAVGSDAYRMIGRTPAYIVAIRPLKDGVISDHNMTEKMIQTCIHKVCGSFLIKPRIVFCVPSLVTEVEMQAVIEAAQKAGARKVYLIAEPIAALLGAGVDISLARGRMVVDIGGGTADIAIISMGGIVQTNSIKMAGNRFDQAIIRYVSQRYKILIGEKMAEETKKELADVCSPEGNRKKSVKGRHLTRGLPEQVELTDFDIYYALDESVRELVEAIHGVLEKTPPELVGDILESGILLTGGGALLGGLADRITRDLGVRAQVADDPIQCVAKGTAVAFQYADQLRDGFERISPYRRS